MGINITVTIRLYCDCEGAQEFNTQGHNANKGEYSGSTKSEAQAAARRAGWYLARGGVCLSPQCRREGRALKKG